MELAGDASRSSEQRDFRGIRFAESDGHNRVGISVVVKISGEINCDADL
jgi:hypothetical protein